MNSIGEYLVKSGIALALLYSFYWLLLRRDTHFNTNRIVLIVSIVVSLALPLIHFSALSHVKPVLPQLTINFDEITAPEGNAVVTESPIAHQPWGFWNWAILIYVAGGAIVLCRLVYQAIYLHAVSRLSKTITYDRAKYQEPSIKTNSRFRRFCHECIMTHFFGVGTTYDSVRVVLMEKDIIPFSYFNRIFISKTQFSDASIPNIIEHERSHLHQYHFIDIAITQILTIIQWFNPFALLIEQSVKEIHEFLADKSVLRSGCNQGKYQALLVNQAMGGPVFTITNQFNQSLIKKRIIMMTKMKSPRMARLKAFLLVPVVAVLMMAFAEPVALAPARTDKPASSVVAPVKITGSVTDKSTGNTITGVNIILKGTTTGTGSDTEGNFEIIVPDENAELVFSFVGYKTQAIPVKGNQVINVQMESSAITIDFSNQNSLEATQKIETLAKPDEDVFVAVEELPSYPGGTVALKKFIDASIQYPADAKKNKIEGKVIVNFTVDKEGKVTNAKVMRGTAPSLDEEALRITKSITGWNPGLQHGKPVACRVIMPVEFKLK
jgi:TonB family protein